MRATVSSGKHHSSSNSERHSPQRTVISFHNPSRSLVSRTAQTPPYVALPSALHGLCGTFTDQLELTVASAAGVRGSRASSENVTGQ